MHVTTGDAGALIAATLTQAELAYRGSVESSSPAQTLARRMGARATVVATYEYYHTLVTTGQPPVTEE
ncbi:hypothetical protein PX554_13670 [Sphingomonas sp. H39-1-10]|uniref:hypothetical protein n=1 Tax=Sphingomonas pollutisoli TaxID=3030829 RepID=UPI0023B8AF77|nr:hypothetical protein [Sphingomonas pollutisoli]MDF0489184.1 hypothetical protein [Sphingomonas pollutisoli]